MPDATDDNSGANKDRKAGERHDFKIKHRSFKTRPGALKKKEKLVAMEMDRFKKNMALMAAGSTIRNQESEVGNEKMSETHELERNQGGSRERWAAIRSFISQTMERRPDGKKLVEKG